MIFLIIDKDPLTTWRDQSSTTRVVKSFHLPLRFLLNLALSATLLIVNNCFVNFLQNLLAGALYGLKIGLPCVCILTACGASCCFIISRCLGRPVLLHYFPQKLQNLQNKVGWLTYFTFFYRTEYDIRNFNFILVPNYRHEQRH